MKTNRVLAQRIFTGGSLAFLLIACGGAFGQANSTGALLNNAACPELRGGAMNANFDADAKANATIRAFVTASGDLAEVAVKAEAEVGGACERIARDLGAAPGDLDRRGDESRVAAACRAASARIDAILQQGAQAKLTAKVTPPQCQVRADVESQCKAQCAGSVDPGSVQATCAPGQLRGKCEGQCTGQCSGTCNGECEGTCAGHAGGSSANGKCAGQCNGTCKGSCNAECKGGCSVEFKEPKCDVKATGPSADVHCNGSCKARADLEAQCSPAQVDVRATANTGELEKLVATLRANLPALVTAQVAYGQRIADDIQVLVRAGAELPNAVGRASARAGACIAAAANATLAAQASLRVSVQASASISAKAGAGTGG